MPVIYAEWLKSNQNLKIPIYLCSRPFKRNAYYREKNKCTFRNGLKVSNNIFRDKWTTRHQRPLRNVFFAKKSYNPKMPDPEWRKW